MPRPFSLLFLLFLLGTAAGCVSHSGSTGGSPGNQASQPAKSTHGASRYDCYTYVGSNHVLTLPLPEADAAFQSVQITFHGDRLPAIYQRNGLTQLWILDEDGLYVQLDPDFVGRYMDFRGAETGEKRQAEAVFECKRKRR